MGYFVDLTYEEVKYVIAQRKDYLEIKENVLNR
jgi:hypothetical protein